MKLKLSLLAIAAVAATAATAEVTDWYEVVTENRPFVRWWWLGSAVDEEGLKYNLDEFAEKGLGGVEITPIYGVKGNEANDIQYLSPRWMDMLEYTVATSDSLGMQVDMNNGTGWPFGGPEVGMDKSARKLVTARWSLDKGGQISDKIVPSDAKQRPGATLQKVIAINGDKRIDITDKVSKDTILKWKAPSNGWNVYAIFSGPTFQKVKRAAPGGEGFVLNHYDSIAVKDYLKKFDRAFEGHASAMPNTFFNDSYEVYGSDWTDTLLDEFYNDHGYRLELYIDEFTGSDHNDHRARVVRDYRYTLARMLQENFTKVWTSWAHSKGARIRNQSHGSPANILDIYAAVDIPECESFGQSDFDIPGLSKTGPSRPSDADPAVLKFASSAAHLAGRPLTSAETLTWLTEHFNTTLARCKPELDQMLSSGVNHVYFHGAPYSPARADFPGWLFYASINMSPTNSIWADAGELFSYVSRAQAFLSAGSPDNDYLLYFPIEDIWYRQDGNPYLMFDIHKMDRRMPDVKKNINTILSEGYDVDYVSDALLDSLDNRSNRLVSRGDNSYRAVIVPDVKFMQPATLRRLIDLAEAGGTVIFTGNLPQDVPGLGDLESRRAQLKAQLDRLPAYKADATATDFGKGKIIYAADIPAALAADEGKPELLRKDYGVNMIRRRNEAGGYNYFISMLKNDTINGYVPLATAAESVMIFDPLTGKSGKAMTRKNAEGELEVMLQLTPGESLMLKTFDTEVEAPLWVYMAEAGEPVEINRGWRLQFVESEPAIEGVFEIDSIIDWTRLPHPDAARNFGRAAYEVTFDLPADAQADDWMLDLGDVRESARVWINGQYAGTAWAVPFTLEVGQYLHPGENTMRIEVTSLQANRIADFERRGVEWRKFKDANIASVTNAKEFSFGDWDTVPAGLNSTVKLIPMKKI